MLFRSGECPARPADAQLTAADAPGGGQGAGARDAGAAAPVRGRTGTLAATGVPALAPVLGLLALGYAAALARSASRSRRA